MELVTLLLLSLLVKGESYRCTQLNALQDINFGGFVIKKTENNYKVQLCSSNVDCFINKDIASCDGVCRFCRTVLSNQGKSTALTIIFIKINTPVYHSCVLYMYYTRKTECTRSQSTCERRVDEFLNNYYRNASFNFCETGPRTTPVTVIPTPTTSSKLNI